MLTRRSFVALGTSALATSAFGTPMAFARAATQRRFVFIIQRGAADGLGTLAPVGDPAFDALITDCSSFEELPVLMPELARGDRPGLVHVIRYEEAD